jgi:putative hemolysin
MSRKNIIWIMLVAVILVLICLAVYFLFLKNQSDQTNQENSQLANPASVYCVNHGGRSEIRTASDSSQTGYCIFANGKECEEWAYFRGECTN